MIEIKCKICGDWISAKKIAMHYWNIHHEKYSAYKNNEEEREIAEQPKVEEIKVEQPKVEQPKVEATKVEKPEIKEIPVEKVEVKTEEEKTEIPSPERWEETAHLFDGPVTNETRNEYRSVQSPCVDNITMNEWCN